MQSVSLPNLADDVAGTETKYQCRIENAAVKEIEKKDRNSNTLIGQKTFWAYSRFLEESFERLGKAPSCSKHPTRMTWDDNAVFTTTPRAAQFSPDLPEIFVQRGRVELVSRLKQREIDQLSVRHFRTRNVVQNTFSSGLYRWCQYLEELDDLGTLDTLFIEKLFYRRCSKLRPDVIKYIGVDIGTAWISLLSGILNICSCRENARQFWNFSQLGQF